MTTYTYTTLDVPVSGSTTDPDGINSSGEVIGFYYSSSITGHGFLYSGGTYASIVVPGSTTTDALGINDSGQVVGDYGDYQDGSGYHVFL